MKIFVLLSRFPYPLEKGDKLRAYNQIKQLSANHEIILCALSDRKIPDTDFGEVKKFCKEIHIIQLSRIHIFWNLFRGLIFSRHPLQVAYFHNKSAQRKIEQIIQKIKPEHIYCQLIRVTEYTKHIKEIPKTLDYMDALSSGMERRAQNANTQLKPFLKIEALRLKRYEHFIFKHFESKTIISEQDRELIISANNDSIHIVPNGVDFSFFHPNTDAVREDAILFTGNMSYPPNVLGVNYIVKEILPLVHEIFPDCKLIIAGANPDPVVRSLASEKVEVTGWVNDIRPYYWKSNVMLAPMQIGSGLQNKLLEALAMCLPCVTSVLANNALKAKPGIDVLIGKTPEEYASGVVKLLQNDTFASEIAENGYKFVKENYSWYHNCQKLDKIIQNKKINGEIQGVD